MTNVSTETRPGGKDSTSVLPPELAPRPSGLRVRHLIYAVIFSALALGLGVLTGLVLVIPILGLAIALVFGGVYLYAGRRSTQQDALLWALAVTAEHGMPLAPTFDVVAGLCRGTYRRRVQAGAYELRQGHTLPQVLEREPRLFPSDARVLARVGHNCGSLAAALRESAQSRALFRGPWMALSLRFSYLLWVLIILQTIVGFTFYFILPKYQAIFADFGVPLPSITILIIDISSFLGTYAFIVLPLVLLEYGLLLVAVVSATGVLPWDVPLVAGLFFRRHSAILLRCLAHVVEAKRPMVDAMQNLVRTYPAEPIRNRLRSVLRDVEAGEDWCRALGTHRLIRPSEEALLEAAKKVGNLPWALRQAAENSERRLTYQFQLWVQWFLPLCVMLAGVLVIVIVVAYFTPLLVLIQKLSG
jgi:type II secretory pathway component PulF